jgi:Leucine-rich repeat (LRR) protein
LLKPPVVLVTKKLIPLLVLGFVILTVACSELDVNNVEKKIISFRFVDVFKDSLDLNVTATIDEKDKTITALLPYGASLLNLTPAITISKGASISPGNGEPLDFTAQVNYTVTAEDGTTAVYSVAASVKPYPENKIISFKFLASKNLSISKDIEGEIDDINSTILIFVPCSVNLNNLKPTVEISDDASVQPLNEASTDFSNEVRYTVTSGLNNTRFYKIVVEHDTQDRQALIDFYKANPGNLLGWDLKKTSSTWQGVTISDCRVVELGIFGGNITTIPSSVGSLTKVKMFQLTENSISDLPAEFGNMESLEILQLSYNKFTTLPSAICNLKSVTDIVIDNNQLTSIPSAIGNLKTLRDISLAENNLTILPEQLTTLNNLEGINVMYNQLESLPNGFKNLVNLNYLNIGGNALNQLPSDIGYLTKLNQLMIWANKLESLPSNIGNLTVLTECYAQDNKLATLPSSIENLKNLKTFYLSNNGMETIPSELGNMSGLEELHLEKNNLNEIPKELGNVSGLRYLNLTNNKLTSLPASVCNLKDNGTVVVFDADVTCN